MWGVWDMKAVRCASTEGDWRQAAATEDWICVRDVEEDQLRGKAVGKTIVGGGGATNLARDGR